ncbi:MAG: NAD(P)/FAD-dependent oxidoreductase [Solirubrobacteraceae bacterium]
MPGVVIAGGGLAAQRCAETLRRVGYERSVAIVCGEPHRPYDRPPLSKEVLLDADADEGVPLRAADWYEGKAVELLLGARASGFDAAAHRLRLEDGSELEYEHLVVATGAKPRLLPAFAGRTNVSTLRTFEDAQRLRDLLAARARLLIIGAGFIGQEVAAAARAAGTDVAIVEAERLPLVGLLGELIGGWFAELHRREGVELLLETTVEEIHGEETVEAVTLSDGRRLACDHVLVGIGVRPDLAWVEGSGLPTDGIPTDAAGRTSLPGVYAAGDAAAFHDPYLERHALTGHWEAAGRQGAAVANAIAGTAPGPPALSSFWSDQYGTRIQYLGHAHLADEVAIDGDPGARDFVAVYRRAGTPIAALIVGRPRAVAEWRDRLSHLTERTAA